MRRRTCAARDRDRVAIVVDAVGDHLRRRLLIPGYQTDRVGIGFQDDVAVDRVGDILVRIIAGVGLDEDALRQAEALVLDRAQELVAGEDLAAGDAVDVGDDALDLGDPALPKPLLKVGHRRPSGWLAPGRGAEGRKQAPRDRALLHLPFRVPLHPEREAPGRLHAHGLDRPILGHRLHDEPWRQSIDTLAMQRVDLDPRGPAQQPLEPAAGGEVHWMGQSIALRPRLGLVGAVVAPARQLVHMLVQAAAQRHVELLDAAADGQERHAAGNRAADQRQRGGVAVGVGEVALPRRRAAIESGIDVRRASGDEDAIQPVQQRLMVEALPDGWDQHRDRLGTGDHGIDILLADAVEVKLVTWLQAGGDADQRHRGAVGHRVQSARSPAAINQCCGSVEGRSSR